MSSASLIAPIAAAAAEAARMAAEMQRQVKFDVASLERAFNAKS